MTIGRICCREVDTAERTESVKTAAQRMDSRSVGTLVVLGQDERPIGIVTDRDLALRVVGFARDPLDTFVGDVMTTNVHTAFEEMPIEIALTLMRSQSVRRLLVVRKTGELVGIVTLDDVLELLAEELGEVGRLIRRESPRAFEPRSRAASPV
jgi:CBS domain-containing protein